MYKFFLCLRYLKSRALAYAAMLAVALCVAMMLIVVSVMNGFLDKVETAAKGLFGDVVIDTAGLGGLGNYDELIAAIGREVSEVEAASPFILSYGMIRIPNTEYRRAVQIAGVRLPERVKVSTFGQGLFVQEGVTDPTFDPPLEQMVRSAAQAHEFTLELYRRKRNEAGDLLSRKATEKANVENELAALQEVLDRLETALQRQQTALERLELVSRLLPEMTELRRKIGQLKAQGKTLEDQEYRQTAEKLDELVQQAKFYDADHRIILGLGIQGLVYRTDEGQTVRMMLPGHQVLLYVFPLGRQMTTSELEPNRAMLTVVDDSRTDVSSIDSEFVYVPFETLQQLNNMHADGAQPARCSQIHVKVRGHRSERELEQVAERIRGVWAKFRREYPLAAMTDVAVQTWRQRQARVIAPIEAQRTLVVVMFSIISSVAVVMILVIFYMIVVQKTRDIGVLKAVGASSGGVAWIFLLYGAFVGLVGAVVGTIGGYLFVWNINPIHDWVSRVTGLTVFTREFFLFEQIPNTVNGVNALLIVLATIAAGLIGALAPAIRAARMQPVEALRYE